MNTSVRWVQELLKLIFCILIPFVSAYLFYTYVPYHFDVENSQTSKFEIAKFTATISATLLGFLLTAVAVLTALMDKTLIANMRLTGHYPKFLKMAFLASFIFLIVTILGFLVLLLYPIHYAFIVFCLMIGFFILALLLLLITGYSFYKMIIHI